MTFFRRRAFWAALGGAAIFVALVACSSKSSSSETTGTAMCSPLAAPSIALPTVYGIGKDTTGTLYVIAPGTVELRVFVVESGALHEQEVVGAGGGPSGDGQYTVTFVAPDTENSVAKTLLANVTNGRATAMALGTTATKGFIGDPSEANDEMLALEDASSIAALPVIGLPLNPEHVAQTPDGKLLVVFWNDAPPSRIFYGPSTALAERKLVIEGGEARDAGYTFDVDGEEWVANFHYFPASKGEAGIGQTVTGDLTTPSGKVDLMVFTDDSAITNGSFTCL